MIFTARPTSAPEQAPAREQTTVQAAPGEYIWPPSHELAELRGGRALTAIAENGFLDLARHISNEFRFPTTTSDDGLAIGVQISKHNLAIIALEPSMDPEGGESTLVISVTGLDKDFRTQRLDHAAAHVEGILTAAEELRQSGALVRDRGSRHRSERAEYGLDTFLSEFHLDGAPGVTPLRIDSNSFGRNSEHGISLLVSAPNNPLARLWTRSRSYPVGYVDLISHSDVRPGEDAITVALCCGSSRLARGFNDLDAAKVYSSGLARGLVVGRTEPLLALSKSA